MQFCEKCNYVTADDACPKCGNKKLRAVNGEDYCYFCNMSAYDFETFEFTLKDNEIEAVGAPYYSGGVSRGNAGRADGRKVYIRYKDLEQAKEIYQTIFGSNG